MSYKVGDILLIKFPFTNLKKHKKRPVIVIKSENELEDIVCFQITSNSKQTNLLKLENKDMDNSNLTLESYIKYDKCFTISSTIAEKRIAKVNIALLVKLKKLFCSEIF